MASAKLILERHRWELIGSAILLILLSAIAIWIAVGYSNLAADGCFAGVDPMPPDCASRTQTLNGVMPVIQAGAIFVPPFTGLVLGVTIVAREIEMRTAMFAWSYAGSRVRWLLPRVVVLAVPLVSLSLVLGYAVDAIYAAALPSLPVEHNLQDLQLRGPLLAAHALLAFGGALLVGAIVGRQLPALLASVAVCALLVGGGIALADTLNKTNPVVEPGPGSLSTGSLFRTTDGRVLTAEEAAEELPTPDADFWSAYEHINVGIPGDRAPLFVARTLIAMLFVAGVLIVGTAITVERRRPY